MKTISAVASLVFLLILSACASQQEVYYDSVKSGYASRGMPGAIDAALKNYVEQCGSPGNQAYPLTNYGGYANWVAEACDNRNHILGYGLFSLNRYSESIPYLEQIKINREAGLNFGPCIADYFSIQNDSGPSLPGSYLFVPKFILDAKKLSGAHITKNDVYEAYVCGFLVNYPAVPRDENGFFQDLGKYGSTKDVADAHAFIKEVATPIYNRNVRLEFSTADDVALFGNAMEYVKLKGWDNFYQTLFMRLANISRAALTSNLKNQ